MAKAGERYDVITGNIWSYSHRGDLTGIKTALARGVDINITNTVGWTACHAAASGGQCRSIRLLARSGADIHAIDNGGNMPAHQAALNGHAKALEILQDLGADVTRVRLSQSKGKEVRDIVSRAIRKKKKKERRANNVEGTNVEEDEETAAVGYARKQSKSTAFWGPRKTPISCKIKKKIIKDKRRLRKEQKNDVVEEPTSGVGQEGSYNCERNANANANGIEKVCNSDTGLLSYKATVQKIKRESKQGRRRRLQGCKLDQESESEDSCDRTNEIHESIDGSDEFVSCSHHFANLKILNIDSDNDTENDEQ
mmetsp:Transcript_18314/g.21080  ORF Transcript_18314/g.21080 Transcript_18314/m.21080 type:complete len:311 (-) Transcript_18314:113-1045(-)|eukprot:CAMPEP_0194387410 /NCGR_PEP_ID=MMETSP0174-20130528/92194_1 /TAXON_ID=216777 /ORGANISM="Proboscia alata, Strain PI-D3" /LENGTH=310 /DNA_ID=CAMNT_0039177569 /DNA_START=112 /DNA_END=1044 /DNA_ORIENTATION=-